MAECACDAWTAILTAIGFAAGFVLGGIAIGFERDREGDAP